MFKISTKALIFILSAVILLALSFLVYNNYLHKGSQGDVIGESETSNETASYFQERMTTRGIADVGHPIEGFNADLLTTAFPGLVEEDFAGVEAIEGHYEVENGERVFVRNEALPLSSAARTITAEGYATLFANVAARLDITTNSREAVDELINAIDTGERVSARIDEGASALGVKVIPHEVIEDSRCPIDVTCAQAGTVRVRAALESGLGTADQVFTLGEPVTTETEIVTLVQVHPIPESGSEIKDGSRTFVFEILKR